MQNAELTRDTTPASTSPRAHWPADLQTEFQENAFNACVGSVLVSETDRVRVWHLSIPAGRRCNFHRHVLNYFWTAHNPGKALNYLEDGSIVEAEYFVGETKHMDFREGEYMIHAVENVGDTDLLFTTVEFLNSPNQPLPVPDAMRLKSPS